MHGIIKNGKKKHFQILICYYLLIIYRRKFYYFQFIKKMSDYIIKFNNSFMNHASISSNKNKNMQLINTEIMIA